MKYVRIPMDRIAVLIGHEGKTKQYIEQKTNIPIEINSETGEVTIDDHEIESPFIIFKVENIIKAIGRGFSPQQAFKLFHDDYDLFIFDIRDYVKKKSSHIHRVKARIIGTDGKTKRILEEITGSNISIYGHTISVIGDIIDIDITKKAIDKLLQGSKHATVYRYVEQSMKELRLHQGF
ncbi:MAG: RNA-processing protein [Candidatus Thermoplasmatota archaeon]|nr:RNA-processing protein [Candidatus Thermoplasmatota archaeon]MBS3802281.1 RNA-processing protein [Candidatus Thermoplasmatota archaeon]